MRSRTRTRFASLPRILTPRVDRLEVRELLSTASGLDAIPLVSNASPRAGFVASPMFELGSLASSTSPPPGAFTPAQVQAAYGFSVIKFGSVQGDGTGQTIAIVDAMDDPNIQADLN